MQWEKIEESMEVAAAGSRDIFEINDFTNANSWET